MIPRSLREAFYREYMTFFERSERTRRWNLFRDLPWERLRPLDDGGTRADDLALCAETFCGVELYLPDYLAGHLELMRDDVGRAWFAAAWGYEESKHSLALREYLLRSGHRSEDQLFDYAERVLERRWSLPYATPRQMTAYGAVQELTTFVVYRRQRELATGRGHDVLGEVYRYIGRDEMAHARFYQRMLQLHLVDDREGTLADLAHVLRTFRMPAEELLEGYDERIAVMRTAGIDRSVYFAEVVLPSLNALGLTRHDLPPSPSPKSVPAPCGTSSEVAASRAIGRRRAVDQ